MREVLLQHGGDFAGRAEFLVFRATGTEAPPASPTGGGCGAWPSAEMSRTSNTGKTEGREVPTQFGSGQERNHYVRLYPSGQGPLPSREDVRPEAGGGPLFCPPSAAPSLWEPCWAQSLQVPSPTVGTSLAQGSAQVHLHSPLRGPHSPPGVFSGQGWGTGCS